MNSKAGYLPYATLIWLSLSLSLSQFSSASDFKNDGEALVGQFKSELKTELVSAINKGGAVSAIAVCAEKAPLIASRLSRLHGVKLQRVSEQTRNPLNTPSESQSEMLEYFAQNPDESTLFLEKTAEGISIYAEAIRTGALCLSCHGSNISPEVSETLKTSYPFDQATGYKLGELRGLFSVEMTSSSTK